MKYYVVEITFLRPRDTFGDAVAQHRAWLQTGYDQGVLLCSGPLSDASGGVLVGRAEDVAPIQALIDGDPYRLAGLASYRILEFDAVKKAALLEAA